VDVYHFARSHPAFDRDLDRQALREECLQGLNFVKDVLREAEHPLVVVDEVLVSVRDGFLTEKEVRGIIDAKPPGVELVLTGRGASQKLRQMASLVTEMKNVKHPFDSGEKEREGIEY